LNTIWSALKNDPIKSTSAIAATVSAFASIGAFIVGYMNLKRDNTKVSLVVKRANNGPLILQHPDKEYLLFEVYNQGVSDVVINEVGIKVPRRFWKKARFINLVDLPYSYLDIRGQEDAIGTLECVGLPGTIPARLTGILLIDYSQMREKSNSFQEQNLSSESSHSFGAKRVIDTFQEFQNLEITKKNILKIIPYVLTGSNERFTGKKATIKLGNLLDTVSS
jgi:hypothetical protein